MIKVFFVITCALIVNNFSFDRFVVGQYVYNRGYYWRDYTGLIPYDAVKGGVMDGKTTYIGQILITNISSILPATIFKNKTVFTLYGEASLEENDVKVLCSKNHLLLRWIKVTPDRFPNPYDLIYGGLQNGSRLYIGRVVLGNNTIFGKVFDENNEHKKGLHINTNDGEIVITTYDILSHRPPMKDYYWRDYIGYIPDDAIEGGIFYEEPSYIGQGMNEPKEMVRQPVNTRSYYTTPRYNNQGEEEEVIQIIPINIFAGNLSAVAYLDNRFSIVNDNLKVLCSGHKENFVWVPQDDLNNFETEDFITGGYSKDTDYLIGKTNTEFGEVIRYVDKKKYMLNKAYDFPFELLAYKTLI